jgi:hypothetical protein
MHGSGSDMQLLSELSGFTYLYMMYSIFVCLGVSSASAERALSKLSIIKNRLRLSMSDDYLYALQLNDDDIISRFACDNHPLRAQLLR